MIKLSELARVQGRPAHDSAGEPIGTVDQIYMSDDETEPRWVTVRDASDENRQHFAPVEGADVTEAGLRLAWSRAHVLASPPVAAVEHIGPTAEAALFEHYALGADHDHGRHAAPPEPPKLGEVVRDTGEAAVTLFGERPVTGTEEVTRQLRLRRYVVTETETIEVPVKRERLAIERVIDAAGGTEVVDEFTLREERVVSVRTETFAVEDVHIDKAVVTEEEQVTVEVSRERLDVDAEPTLVSDPDRETR